MQIARDPGTIIVTFDLPLQVRDNHSECLARADANVADPRKRNGCASAAKRFTRNFMEK